MPLPSFNTPKMVRVSNKLPMVNTLMSQTIIQNANVFRLDIFSVSSESDVFDFIALFDFILLKHLNRTQIFSLFLKKEDDGQLHRLKCNCSSIGSVYS